MFISRLMDATRINANTLKAPSGSSLDLDQARAPRGLPKVVLPAGAASQARTGKLGASHDCYAIGLLMDLKLGPDTIAYLDRIDAKKDAL